MMVVDCPRRLQYRAMGKGHRQDAKGLRQLLDPTQQRDWLEGIYDPVDIDERAESFEQRFRYAARFQKLLGRPQAPALFEILAIYGRACIPVPRLTERYYWSVSCLPSTSDKPLVRVNASWMELFTLYADELDLRARFILHLSDFTTDGSVDPARVDHTALGRYVPEPAAIGCSFPRGADIFGIKVAGAAAIRSVLDAPPALRSIRRFNLTHMNRGRNAYQASHCYSVADYMLGEGDEGDDRP